MRTQVTAQIQSENLDLYRLQTQLSTGLRIFLPSDDASAALRAVVLQSTLERKDQSLTNIQGATNSLNAALGSLSGVTTDLNKLHAEALGVTGTLTTESDRQNVINSLNTALLSLVTAANSKFTDSYLFTGNEASQAPYRFNDTNGGSYVEFNGNERSSQTFADIGVLFDASISGNEVFGGISNSVFGSNDLDAQLSRDTKLSQLNGGLGVGSNGALALTFVPTSLSEPTTNSTVNFGNASTIGDVIQIIEANLPENADVRIEVSGNGLSIKTSNGALAIREVSEGRTALELGITGIGVPQASIQGDDLDPTIQKTTALTDLSGIRSRGAIELTGNNNDLLIQSVENGSQYNGLTIEVVDGAAVGFESASYNSGTNTLTVTIADGESTTKQAVAAINAEGTFFSETDTRDTTSKGLGGSGPFVAGTYNGVTQGGGGGAPDLASGLIVTNGEGEYIIDTSSAETVQDLLNLFNRKEYGMIASINAAGDGIDVRSRRSGADFTIGENGGSTATDLGIRSYTGDSRLEDFNRGTGVAIIDEENQFIDNTFDITIVDAGVSTTYTIDTENVTTVDELIAEINTVTGGNVTASLATVGNGLTLTGTTAAVPGTPSSGTVGLAGDTLQFTATAVGPASDQAFTVEIIDSGSGGLGTAVSGNTITVDLGGASNDTAAIAADIESQISGYTVASNGTAAVSAPVAQASFSTTGGIATNPSGVDSIEVSGGAAERLGFIDTAQDTVSSNTGVLTSRDTNPNEVDSMFTTLIRLRDALVANDTVAIGNEVNRIEEDLDRITLARAEIGTRINSLDSYKYRIQDEEINLKDALSQEIEVDLVKTASDFAAAQVALEISLQTSASLLQLSILDYL